MKLKTKLHKWQLKFDRVFSEGTWQQVLILLGVFVLAQISSGRNTYDISGHTIILGNFHPSERYDNYMVYFLAEWDNKKSKNKIVDYEES